MNEENTFHPECEHHGSCPYDYYCICSILYAKDAEIERLRKWASYEHAGYCPCAGGNPECVNGAYEVWKSMQ